MPSPGLRFSAWALLLCSCQGRVAELSLPIEPPSALVDGCRLSRRASLRGEDGRELGKADAPARAIGDGNEPLRFEATDDGSSPWRLELDELDVCGAVAAHFSGQVDPRSGALLDGAAWAEGAHCPQFPFERTTATGAVYNPCIQTGCAATVEQNGCSIQVQVADYLSCSLPNDGFEIHGRQGVLESASCTNVSALEAGDGSVIAADCGASCEIQLESDAQPFLERLSGIDPYALLGCDPVAGRGLTGALAPDGSLFVGVQNCTQLLRLDGPSGALLGMGAPALPLLVHPSGRLLALRGAGELVAIDPDSMAVADVLGSIGPGLPGRRHVSAIWVAERDQLLVAGFYYDDARGEVISGLLYSARVSKSATRAVTLYDRSDLSDVRYAQAEPIWLGGDRLVLIQHLEGSNVPGYFRVGERSLATGALGPDWDGFARTGTRPSLAFDPIGHRVLVTKDGFLFGCSDQGVCQSSGQALWSFKAYASLHTLPEADLALAVVTDKLLGAHRLEDLSRRRGALMPLAGPPGFFPPTVLHTRGDTRVYVLSTTIERFRLP